MADSRCKNIGIYLDNSTGKKFAMVHEVQENFSCSACCELYVVWGRLCEEVSKAKIKKTKCHED